MGRLYVYLVYLRVLQKESLSIVSIDIYFLLIAGSKFDWTFGGTLDPSG